MAKWLSVRLIISGFGFESSCSHLNFRFRTCFEQGVPWHSGNYRVWIHSEVRMWHDKNIQTDKRLLSVLPKTPIRRKKRKRMAIVKLFVLHTNTIKACNWCRFVATIYILDNVNSMLIIKTCPEWLDTWKEGTLFIRFVETLVWKKKKWI